MLRRREEGRLRVQEAFPKRNRLVELMGLGAAAVLLAASGAQAGPHADGRLILHVNPNLEYSFMSFDMEGQSDLRDCEDAITQGRVDAEKAQVWYVLASFAESPGPVDLAGVSFGFESYDPSKVSILAHGLCKGTSNQQFEVASPGWPGPNEGVAVAFMPPRRGELIELYWFASYVYGEETVELGYDPQTDSAMFGSGAVPSELDEIFEFGALGFGQPGYNPCATGPVTGACCVFQECRLLSRDECESLAGRYLGDNTACFPDPCGGQAVETTWGMLKRLYR